MIEVDDKRRFKCFLPCVRTEMNLTIEHYSECFNQGSMKSAVIQFIYPIGQVSIQHNTSTAQSTELVSLYIGYWTLNNYYYLYNV